MSCPHSTVLLGLSTFIDKLFAISCYMSYFILLYFAPPHSIPPRWYLWVAFAFLVGSTRLLDVWKFPPCPFPYMPQLTILKIVTAIVSWAVVFSLHKFVPPLLQAKAREFSLKKNVIELTRESETMRQQRETRLRVWRITRDISQTLDRDTIIGISVDKLSKLFNLHSCTVWMPNEYLTLLTVHGDNSVSIPLNDYEARDICESRGINILVLSSMLRIASYGAGDATSVAVAVRIQVPTVFYFRGGPPQWIPERYGILVLVFPTFERQTWIEEELEMIAHRIGTALYHASHSLRSHR